MKEVLKLLNIKQRSGGDEVSWTDEAGSTPALHAVFRNEMGGMVITALTIKLGAQVGSGGRGREDVLSDSTTVLLTARMLLLHLTR